MAIYVCPPTALPEPVTNPGADQAVWAKLRRLGQDIVRRFQPPASVARLAAVVPEERVLVGTCDETEAAIIATDCALHRLEGDDSSGRWSRWGWHEVTRIDWWAPQLRLTVIDESGRPCVPAMLTIPVPGPLVEVAKERVAWATVLAARIEVASGCRLGVLVRRRPRTVELTYFLYPDSSLDPNDPVVRSELDHALAVLRVDTGI